MSNPTMSTTIHATIGARLERTAEMLTRIERSKPHDEHNHTERRLMGLLRDTAGDLRSALARLAELEVTGAEERAAWARFASAAAIATRREATDGDDDHAWQPPMVDVAEAVEVADELLAEYRKRFAAKDAG